MATRPLTSASLVSAKLKAAIPSTLASWLLLLVAIPIALRLSGTSWVAIDDARHVVEVFGTPRAIAMGLLGASALVVSTWKRLVQSLFIGMSGRVRLVRASVFGNLTLLTLWSSYWSLGSSTTSARSHRPRSWNILPWILAVSGQLGKMISAAGWTRRSASTTARRRRRPYAGLRRAPAGTSPCSPSTACSCGWCRRCSSPVYGPGARRDPGHPSGTTVRGPAGAIHGIDTDDGAATTVTRQKTSPRCGVTLCSACRCSLTLVEAVSFHVTQSEAADRSSPRTRNENTCSSSPTELRRRPGRRPWSSASTAAARMAGACRETSASWNESGRASTDSWWCTRQVSR